MSEDICLAVDSACDLPDAFIRKHGIRILPIKLILGQHTFLDTRDPHRTLQLYASKSMEEHFSAETEPATPAEIAELMEAELAPQYENVLAISISSKRSGIHSNLREAAVTGEPRFRDARRKTGQNGHFKIKVVDSQTLFTGQGLLAYEALKLIKQTDLGMEKIAARLERVKQNIRAYLVPNNLYHLRNRASAKGDKTVGWLGYQVGTLLDVKPIIEARNGETQRAGTARGFSEGIRSLFERAEAAIDHGLSVKAINMSYSGKLRELESMTEYRAFVERCHDRGIATPLSVMSTTAAINVGPGALSLAFAEA